MFARTGCDSRERIIKLFTFGLAAKNWRKNAFAGRSVGDGNLQGNLRGPQKLSWGFGADRKPHHPVFHATVPLEVKQVPSGSVQGHCT